LIIILIFLSSCEKQTTPIETSPTAISLKLVDVAVTETWLQLRIENKDPDYCVTVYRDTTEIYDQPADRDTLLYDDNLLPDKNYTYRATLWKQANRIAESNTLTTTTMDTTSHAFTWLMDTIGTHNSVLNDVAVINENDIWVVGDLHFPDTYTYDSLGNFIQPYNIAHWDGTKWNLLRMMVPGPGYGEIYSVYAIDPLNIWFGSNIAAHYDTQQWTFYHTGTGFPSSFRISKIWGDTPENLFFVGNDGNIVRYNGSTFNSVSTGFDIDFHDVWGDVNPKTGKTEIIVVGSNASPSNRARILLQFDDPYIREISSEGLPWRVSCLWFKPGKRYYVAGDGLYAVYQVGELWQKITTITPLYKSGIRGNDINDVIVVGSFALVSHFNGMSWHNYVGEAWPQFDGFFGEVDYKNNFMVAVGQIGDRGLILRGWRH
jgi:hypothetical protein